MIAGHLLSCPYASKVERTLRAISLVALGAWALTASGCGVVLVGLVSTLVVILPDDDDDQNSPPTVSFEDQPQNALDLPPGDGVVPIRYRLFDADRDLVNVTVEVDLQDGLGFRPANEFPLESSEERTGRCTLDPSDTENDTPCRDKGQRATHTFLWDALSQGDAFPQVAVRIQVSGQAAAFTNLLPGFSLAGLHLARAVSVDGGGGPLTSADFNGDGVLDLAVLNSGSDTVTYLEGVSGGFENVRDIPTGSGPLVIRSSDFNADGDIDVIVANFQSDDLTLLLGGPDGLQLGFNTPTGDGPTALATGDYDKDGFCDAAVANFLTDNVTYLRGGSDPWERVSQTNTGDIEGIADTLSSGDYDGDGTIDLALITAGKVSSFHGTSVGLVQTGEVAVEGIGPLVSGDFNGDGNFDVVVGSSNLIFLRGGSTGLVEVAEIPRGEAIFGELTSGDYDGDRFLDLVAANNVSDNVTYLRGGADGLVRIGEIPVGDFPDVVASGDYNGDEFTDLVVGINSEKLPYFRGGRGGLEPVGEVAIDAVTPRDFAIGDYDRDGIDDIALTSERSEGVTLLRGGPVTGLVRARETILDAPIIASGDYDGDGFTDLATANSTGVSVLRGSSIGPVLTGKIPVGTNPSALSSGDYDGDGFLDLAVANSTSDNVSYLRGTSAGLVREDEYVVGDNPTALLSGDYDGDGIPDLAVLNHDSKDVSYLRRMNGKLVEVRKIGVGNEPIDLSSGDYDDDGFLDLAVSNSQSGTVSYLRGTSGGLIGSGQIGVGTGPRGLSSGDYDRDGFVDLIVINTFSSSISYIRGTKDGLVQPEPTTIQLDEELSPRVASSADFNGDGFLDSVILNRDDTSLIFLRGTRGGPVLEVRVPLPGEPTTVAALDFDADGFLDVAVVTEDADDVIFLRGTEQGLVRIKELEIPFGDQPRALSTGDYNGDGFIDLAVANSNFRTSNNIGFLRQRYLLPHVNVLFTPSGNRTELLDPRYSPRYRLELSGQAFDRPTQVCLTPGPHLELPHENAFRRGRYLTFVADPVRLLREGTALREAAILIVSLRDKDPALLSFVLENPDRLRVFKSISGEAAGDFGLLPNEIKIVDFEGGKGVAFPIRQFATYLVAVERNR